MIIMILIQENNNDNRIGTTLLKSKSYQLNTLILKKEKILQKKKGKKRVTYLQIKKIRLVISLNNSRK